MTELEFEEIVRQHMATLKRSVSADTKRFIRRILARQHGYKPIPKKKKGRRRRWLTRGTYRALMGKSSN